MAAQKPLDIRIEALAKALKASENRVRLMNERNTNRKLRLQKLFNKKAIAEGTQPQRV